MLIAGRRFRPLGICIAPDGTGFYVTDWQLRRLEDRSASRAGCSS